MVDIFVLVMRGTLFCIAGGLQGRSCPNKTNRIVIFLAKQHTHVGVWAKSTCALQL